MASIACALERIKGNPLEVLDRQMIERVSRQCHHEWRQRDLDPAATVALFCQQVTRENLSCKMSMDVLRCKTEAGIRKEAAVFCLVYNLVRCAMLEASRRQEVPVSRISFADALYWMRYARPGDRLPELKVNPPRPNRAEPRRKKRRPKQCDLMNKPRAELRKTLKNSGKTG